MRKVERKGKPRPKIADTLPRFNFNNVEHSSVNTNVLRKLFLGEIVCQHICWHLRQKKGQKLVLLNSNKFD